MVSITVLTTATAQAKSIVATFQARGATTPGAAIAWTPEGAAQDYEYKQLLSRGALVEMRPGTWYLNEEKLHAPGGAQGAIVIVLLAVGLLVGGYLLFKPAGFASAPQAPISSQN